jgi:hypothetical protein
MLAEHSHECDDTTSSSLCQADPPTSQPNLVKQHVKLGVNIKEHDVRSCECIPCSESKMRGMAYPRNHRRRNTPLEKLCVDV